MSDGIVTTDDLLHARDELREHGIDCACKTMFEMEPEMFGFLMTAVQCVAGRLVMSGVDPKLIRGTTDEMLESLVTCIHAMRRAQIRLWDASGDDGAGRKTRQLDEENDIPF